jgi:hypothetical protein
MYVSYDSITYMTYKTCTCLQLSIKSNWKLYKDVSSNKKIITIAYVFDIHDKE